MPERREEMKELFSIEYVENKIKSNTELK